MSQENLMCQFFFHGHSTLKILYQFSCDKKKVFTLLVYRNKTTTSEVVVATSRFKLMF